MRRRRRRRRRGRGVLMRWSVLVSVALESFVVFAGRLFDHLIAMRVSSTIWSVLRESERETL